MVIKVLVADDYPIIRSGIRNELSLHPEITIVGEAVNEDETYQMALALQPDVLLLDINMPEQNAASLIRRLRINPVAPHIMVLTGLLDTEYVLAMLRAGAE